jgi:hypothetical protein
MIRALLAAAAIVAAAIGAAPTASADPYGKLVGMMPAGYGPDSCRLVDNPPQFALAVLDCGNNSLPGGPTHARYALSADPGAVLAVFGGYAKLPFRSPVPCGSGDTAGGTWSNKAGTDGGSVACSTSGGVAEVSWTSHSNLFLAHADGPDITPLFQWFLHSVGPQGRFVP